jgi:hypothetical protein
MAITLRIEETKMGNPELNSKDKCATTRWFLGISALEEYSIGMEIH